MTRGGAGADQLDDFVVYLLVLVQLDPDGAALRDEVFARVDEALGGGADGACAVRRGDGVGVVVGEGGCSV